MINQNQVVLVTMPVFCECGKSVWCWFKGQEDQISYTCTCGLKMGEKRRIQEAVISEWEFNCQED